MIDASEHHVADGLKRLSTISQTMESRRLEHDSLEQYKMVADDGETRRCSVGLRTSSQPTSLPSGRADHRGRRVG
jgi:hypothetical protein